MNKAYTVAIILTIPAESYEEACSVADAVADNLSMDAGIGVLAILEYEYDNDGQRVLYLHSEDEPIDLDAGAPPVGC